MNLYEDISKYTNDTYLPLLTQEEKDAIKRYTKTDYEVINDGLRKGKNSQDVEIIRRGIQKFEYGKQVRVFRKIWLNTNEFKLFLDKCERGFILDRAFQSTSIISGGFLKKSNVVIEININNLNAGAYIAPLSFYSREREFLLLPNTRIDIDFVQKNDQYIYAKGRVL